MTDTTSDREPAAVPAPTVATGAVLRALLAADTQVLLRSRQTIVLNLLVPVIFLVVTARASSRAASAGASAGFGNASFEIGLALTYGLIASALMGYSITIARDREAGVFQRLRVAPAPTWAIMLSRLAVQFGAAVITSIVVLALGSIIHQVVFSAGTYVLMFLVGLFGAAMFLGIGQAIVGLIRSTAAVNAVGRVIYIILILLGILGASGVLGNAVKDVSAWTPVGALITLFAGVQQLSAWGWSQTGALLACVGYLVVFAGIGIRWFQWEAR